MTALNVINSTQMAADLERREALPVEHIEHPRGYVRDDKCGGWELWWGGYLYWIEDARLKSENDLLSWVHHVSGKGWEGCTAARVGEFIEDVMSHIGRRLYS